MTVSRLDHPDDPAEHSEHAHSPTFAAVLTDAFTYLATRDFDAAARLVKPFRSWPISQSQRLRLLFILAAAAQHRLDCEHASDLCEEALDLCATLDAWYELAQVALLGARAYHDQQHFATAAATASAGLAAWLALDHSDESPESRTLETDLRDRCALDRFFLGEYAEGLRHVQAARRLVSNLPASPSAALRAADLDWTAALLHRWRGDAHRARRLILGALSTYERLGSPNAVARLRIVVADIALDPLAPVGSALPHHYREDLITLARTNIDLALETIDAAEFDLAGRCMAILADARLGRLLRGDEDRLGQLEAVGHIAGSLHDMPLLGQVYTSLGDHFAAAGHAEIESSRNCYRRALGVIEGSEALAYGVWARRGLHHEAEYQLPV